MKTQTNSQQQEEQAPRSMMENALALAMGGSMIAPMVGKQMTKSSSAALKVLMDRAIKEGGDSVDGVLARFKKLVKGAVDKGGPKALLLKNYKAIELNSFAKAHLENMVAEGGHAVESLPKELQREAENRAAEVDDVETPDKGKNKPTDRDTTIKNKIVREAKLQEFGKALRKKGFSAAKANAAVETLGGNPDITVGQIQTQIDKVISPEELKEQVSKTQASKKQAEEQAKEQAKKQTKEQASKIQAGKKRAAEQARKTQIKEQARKIQARKTQAEQQAMIQARKEQAKLSPITKTIASGGKSSKAKNTRTSKTSKTRTPKTTTLASTPALRSAAIEYQDVLVQQGAAPAEASKAVNAVLKKGAGEGELRSLAAEARKELKSPKLNKATSKIAALTGKGKGKKTALPNFDEVTGPKPTYNDPTMVKSVNSPIGDTTPLPVVNKGYTNKQLLAQDTAIADMMETLKAKGISDKKIVSAMQNARGKTPTEIREYAADYPITERKRAEFVKNTPKIREQAPKWIKEANDAEAEIAGEEAQKAAKKESKSLARRLRRKVLARGKRLEPTLVGPPAPKVPAPPVPPTGIKGLPGKAGKLLGKAGKGIGTGGKGLVAGFKGMPGLGQLGVALTALLMGKQAYDTFGSDPLDREKEMIQLQGSLPRVKSAEDMLTESLIRDRSLQKEMRMAQMFPDYEQMQARKQAEEMQQMQMIQQQQAMQAQQPQLASGEMMI